MLDGLLGRGFSAKCKSSIKQTKARIDVIRRKRNAMQKFLKKDVADLLANSLDINAYGRAEGLYVELNLSSCYDFVEQFCGCIPLHLSVMQKQRECPEECREAVASLMFAAARFADLPELRDLRDIFTEKYGSSLEPFVNHEFAENLASKPPTVDQKLQLMREIAKEFSIKWDSKAFEQKISSSPAPMQEQPKRHKSFRDPKIEGNKEDTSNNNTVLNRGKSDTPSRGRWVAEDGYTAQSGRGEAVPKIDKQDITYPGRLDVNNDGYTARVRMEEKPDISSRGRRVAEDGYTPQNGRGEVPKTDKHGIASHGRLDLTNKGRGEVPKIDKHDIASHGRLDLTNEGYTPPHVRKEHNGLKGDDQDFLPQGRSKFAENKYKQQKGIEETSTKRDNRDVPSKQEYTEDGFKPNGGRDQNGPPSRSNFAEPAWGAGLLKQNGGRDQNGPSSRANLAEPAGGAGILKLNGGRDQNGPPPSRGNLAEPAGGAGILKPHYSNMIPPYIKPNGGKSIRSTTVDHATTAYRYEVPSAPPIQNKDVFNGRSDRTQREAGDVDFERPVIGPPRIKSHDNEDYHRQQDDLVGEKRPEPRSVRRRHSKPPSGHDSTGNNNEGDEALKQKPSGRGEDTRRGVQHVLDERDDEEKMMDQLLVHYSKKNSGPVKAGARISHHNVGDGSGASSRHRSSRNGVRLNPEAVPPPARAVSLPQEAAEATRIPVRAASFQQDGHVHPKLPDYDDLAARFAALRGR